MCPDGALWQRLLLVAAGGVVAAALVAPARAHAKLSDSDKTTLSVMALQWAIDGGIADFKLLKDPSHLVVANFNLPKRAELHLPGREVTLLSLLRIQALADMQGDFLYFRFDRLRGSERHATVAIALVWAVSAKSRTPYLSGGGATLEFEKRDGRWQLQPVTNRWMS